MQAENSEKNSELFERIQTLRKHLRLTWRELAETLGVADNSLFFHMKKGRTGLSDKVISRLEEVEKEAGIFWEKSCVPQCDADSPMRRLMEIEKEQQQISRQLAEMDNLRRRYAQLLEEQLDILSQLGTSRSYTDEQIAAIRSRHKTKAQLINSAVKKRDT